MSGFVAFFGGQLGLTEILVIAAVGLLLFGSRLPQVGRSLGRSIVQFKKGLHDVEEEVDEAGTEPAGGPPPPKKALQPPDDRGQTPAD